MTVPIESWDTRLQRAEELTGRAEATREILSFYVKLLQSQKEIDEFLRSRRGWLPSGSLVEDLPVIKECLPIVLGTVESNGPAPLVEKARIGTFQSMTNGTVTKEWAWTHHPAWYAEVTGRDPREDYERERQRVTERQRARDERAREDTGQ